MQCFVSAKNKLWQIFFVGVCIVVAALLGLAQSVSASPSSGSSVIGAIVCADAPTITLTGPADGGTVTTSAVVVEGAATQASQIEIMVDGAFDSVIPMNIGQTTFSGAVQISAGTHTIKATAINACGGSDTSAEVEVTYKPESPSEGGEGSHGGDAGGSVVADGRSESSDVASGVSTAPIDTQVGGGLNPIQWAADKIGELASWLNINTADAQDTSLQVLSPWRAIGLTVGAYLAVIGLAPVVLGWFADMAATKAWLGGTTKTRRMRILSVAVRVVGVLVVAAAILL